MTPVDAEWSRLWAHQKRGCDETRRAFASGASSVLLVSPTGSGKGTIAAYMCASSAERGKRCAFVVHRREIVKDLVGRVVRLGVEPGVILGDHPRGDASSPVQLCGVQALVARGELPDLDFVIWDEAHHCAADTYQKVRAAYPKAKHVGLSATPVRADGKALGDAFQRLVVLAQPSELVAAGILVEPDVIAPPKRVKGIVEVVPSWVTHAPGLRTVVFAANKRHATEIASAFRAEQIEAEHIFGDTPSKERDRRIARFASGETLVLVNVGVLTEGTDIREIACVILARGMGGVSQYIQTVGRGLRAAPGKTRAVVLDLAGNVHEHGLPTEDRDYDLDGTGIKARDKEKAPSLRQCLACGAVFRPVPECPICGTEAPPPEVPKTVKAKLGFVRSTPDAKAREWEFLQRQERERGYKRGWAWHRYRARYGENPSRSARSA